MTSCRWKPQSSESSPAKWNKVETNSAPHCLNPFHFSNEENKSSGRWLCEHGRNQKNDIIRIIYYHTGHRAVWWRGRLLNRAWIIASGRLRSARSDPTLCNMVTFPLRPNDTIRIKPSGPDTFHSQRSDDRVTFRDGLLFIFTAYSSGGVLARR